MPSLRQILSPSRVLLALGLSASLAGCSAIGLPLDGGSQPTETVTLTKAQQCAVGYDLSRTVYNQVQIEGTVIHVPRKLGNCGHYAIGYLRKAGFEIVEDAPGTQVFTLSTWPQPSGQGFVASIQLPGLTVSRAYRPGPGGVYALSPASVVQVSQDHP